MFAKPCEKTCIRLATWKGPILKTEQLRIRLSKADARKLAAIARYVNVSKSDVVRMAIVEKYRALRLRMEAE